MGQNPIDYRKPEHLKGGCSQSLWRWFYKKPPVASGHFQSQKATEEDTWCWFLASTSTYTCTHIYNTERQRQRRQTEREQETERLKFKRHLCDTLQLHFMQMWPTEWEQKYRRYRDQFLLSQWSQICSYETELGEIPLNCRGQGNKRLYQDEVKTIR